MVTDIYKLDNITLNEQSGPKQKWPHKSLKVALNVKIEKSSIKLPRNFSKKIINVIRY